MSYYREEIISTPQILRRDKSQHQISTYVICNALGAHSGRMGIHPFYTTLKPYTLKEYNAYEPIYCLYRSYIHWYTMEKLEG